MVIISRRRRELDLAAQVLGALDEHLAHARIGADALQEGEGLRPVAPPEAGGELLGGAGRGHPVEVHARGLEHELVAQLGAGLAVPAALGIGRRRRASGAMAQISSPTLRQSVSLPPKMLTCASPSFTSIDVLAREGEPVDVALAAAADREGGTPQRSAMMSASVSGRSRRRRLLMLERTKLRSSGVTWVNGLSTLVSVVPMQVRGAHGDDEEQAPVVGEEREDALVRREPVDDEVDALGEGVARARRLPGERVVGVDEGPGRR